MRPQVAQAVVVMAFAVVPLVAVLSPRPTAPGQPGPDRVQPSSPTGHATLTPSVLVIGTLPPTNVPIVVASSPPPSAPPVVGLPPDPSIAPVAQPTPNATVKPTPTPASTPRSTPRSTPIPTASGSTSTPAPTLTPNTAPCTVFPSTNVWNRDIATLPVQSDSATLIDSIGIDRYLHPDFSSFANGGYGIPINKVSLSTPRSSVSFDYDDESDPGPYPIPSNPKIEGGSDRHLILWDIEGCDLYEIFAAEKVGASWTGWSGAIWDLRSNALRPDGWTSADAAGLPILPGLVRYEEVAAGAIRHALRFTAPRMRAEHIYPARHHASSLTSDVYPPMGLRVRLKASVDISGFGPQARVILTALKKYGMLLADNGSSWYVTGAPDSRWDDDQLHDFHQLTGADFEVVDTTNLR
jgi:hypothetical protein